MRVPISTAWDPVSGTSIHMTVIPPKPDPTPSPSLEGPSFHETTSGRALGRAKVAATVRLMGRLCVVQQGNDTGPGLGDITLSNPANPLFPAILAASKRKMVFGAERIKVEGATAGAHSVGWPPCPILTCGTPTSLPTVGGPLNLCYPVTLGLAAADLIRGCVDVLVDVVVGLLVSRFFPQRVNTNFGEAWLRTEVIKALAGQLTGRSLAVAAVKSVLYGASVAAIAGEDPSFGLTVGGAGVGVSSRLTFTGEGPVVSSSLQMVGRERVRVDASGSSGVDVSSGSPGEPADALSDLNESLFPPHPQAWL